MTEKEFIMEYRREHRRSRITRAVRYRKNGATVKQEECLRCGEIGPTWCAKWSKTKEAEQWEQRHRDGLCGEMEA